MDTTPGYLLLVEDDPDILKLLSTTLTFRGYRVVTSCNGREALEEVRKDHPALVIADIMMPQLDGFGLVHRLRINPETRYIPIIFITATFLSPEDKEFAMDIGVTRFIQKPLDMEVFLGTLANLLQHNETSTLEPLEELRFYENYRDRLEAKLAQKNRQITRDEGLLGTHSEVEDESLHTAIRHATHERDELKLLLEQVYKYLDKYMKPDDPGES